MGDTEDRLTCPYNRAHVVTKLRMAQHLVKCQENHPHIVLATCYYDFLHRVAPEKLNEHLETCPSKEKFRTRFTLGAEPEGKLDGNVKNISLRTLSSTKKGSDHSFHSFTSTGDGSKGATDHRSHTSTSSSQQMGSKEKGTKDSKPKEESWDTDSSDEGN